jgi:hypothetical protein|tara:strand:+ start:121 stop:435 length:315 start_codon:yes stop_codon:yes gene_type:complete
MAEISINGGKLVSTLKREFKAEYGLTLDVKKGRSNHSAPPSKRLSQIRDPEAKGGKPFKINARMKIGNLEKKFEEMGVKINIKTKGGGFVSNDVTLQSVRSDKE